MRAINAVFSSNNQFKPRAPPPVSFFGHRWTQMKHRLIRTPFVRARRTDDLFRDRLNGTILHCSYLCFICAYLWLNYDFKNSGQGDFPGQMRVTHQSHRHGIDQVDVARYERGEGGLGIVPGIFPQQRVVVVRHFLIYLRQPGKVTVYFSPAAFPRLCKRGKKFRF
jgi:hypothetical protein